MSIEPKKDELNKKLEGGTPHYVVVVIVGMGELGKTTIAKQVYDRVRGKFDFHAWITVSQKFEPEELLRT